MESLCLATLCRLSSRRPSFSVIWTNSSSPIFSWVLPIKIPITPSIARSAAFRPAISSSFLNEVFRRLLERSVRDQLPSIDTTILLSGGLDSTTVAACAVSLRKRTFPTSVLNLRALSVDSQPLVDDRETWLASRFAEKLGIPCQVVHSGEALPFGGWDNLTEPFPEPVLDPYSNLYFSYYRQIALNSRVVLSGVGGDEVLRLQAWPYLRFLYRRKGLFSALSTLGRYVIEHRRPPPLGAGIRSGFQKFVSKKSNESQFPPWFMPDFARRLDLFGRWRAMNSFFLNDTATTEIDTLSLHDALPI